MKNRRTAAKWAIFLGVFGAHFFYLGKTGRGLLCLLFAWSFIPAVISILDAIRFFRMTDEEFKGLHHTPFPPSPAAVDISAFGNTLDDLERLFLLKEKGAISEEEFEAVRQQMFQAV